MATARGSEAGGVLRPNSLGEALRLLRQRAGISRDELASLASVSTGAISNYENDVSAPGAPPLRRICLALANALNCPAAELWEQLGNLLDDQWAPAGGDGPDDGLDGRSA